MTPTPVDGKTIAPPVSRVDKAPETATKLLTRIAVSVEQTERMLRWVVVPIQLAFCIGGTFIVLAVVMQVVVMIANGFHR